LDLVDFEGVAFSASVDAQRLSRSKNAYTINIETSDPADPPVSHGLVLPGSPATESSHWQHSVSAFQAYIYTMTLVSLLQ